MKWGKAFLIGMLAGAVMVLLLAIGRLFGIQANLSMMVGTMFGFAPGIGTWILGFIVHVVLSGLIAFLYAAGFEYITHSASASIGATFSIIHILIGGFMMGLIPLLHPMIPEMMPAPGAFLAGLGVAGVIEFIVLHLVYGILVGAMYSPVKHSELQKVRKEQRPVTAH
jgi:hypothetical protein